MDINPDILSGLKLINSPDIPEQELLAVFQKCDKILTSKQNDCSQVMKCEDQITILVFAINSFILESVKHRISFQSLIRFLQENGIDISTSRFKQFEEFLKRSLKISLHNLEHFELDENIQQFCDLEWSQMLDVRSSTLEPTRKKTYMIDLITKDSNSLDKCDQQQSMHTLCLGERELQDFYATISDCLRNVEHYINA